MSITERAKDMGVENLVKENKKLKEENKKLTEKYIKNVLDTDLENKMLKADLAYERTMLDNVQAEYKSLQKIIKKMEEENEELRINREFEKWNTIFGM